MSLTPLGQAGAAWCARHGLTKAESELVFAALDGACTQVELAASAGVRVSTVKKQVQSICRKSGAASLKLAVIAVFREALAGAAAPAVIPGWPVV